MPQAHRRAANASTKLRLRCGRKMSQPRWDANGKVASVDDTAADEGDDATETDGANRCPHVLKIVRTHARAS